MLDFEGDKKRVHIVTLQLAPMIDVFVLIIVFLIKGTIMEESAIVKPEDVKMAQSISKETSESAPQVIITPDKVEFKMVNVTKPIKAFKEDDFNLRDPIFAAFKKYLSETKNVESANHVNVISDRATPYKTVYHVIKILRISGFQSLLFVAEGETP
jgi:biopolymer transport protein ExbD